jgi:hypothetical protein
MELQGLLVKNFPKKLRYAYSNLYKSYSDYMGEFTRNGGMIQAAPSQLSKNLGSPGILFNIEPDGSVEILSTYEKINAYPFMSCGYVSPQTCLPALNYTSIVTILAQKLYKKGVFGYVHVDLISFPDPFDKKVHP